MTQPPIPTQREQIAAEFRRCVNARADRQHRIVDDLQAVDALTRRMEELLDAAANLP